MEVNEEELLRLVGKILKELLKDESLSREDLIKVAETLEKTGNYFGDPYKIRVIKKK